MKKIFLIFIAVFLFAEVNEFEITDTNNSEQNISNEINFSKTIENFDDNFYSENSKVSFAIIIDKEKFFKFIPSIINSINAYLIQKGVDFNVSVYDKNVDISTLPQKYVIDVETNKSKIKSFINYDKIFFIPTFNKNEFNETFENVYFGGINFKKHIESFSSFINHKLITISQNNQISKKLLNYEKKNPFFVKNYNFPKINYYSLKNSFIILNTESAKSAQILSNITSKDINTFLIFSPQLCYSPTLIFLTQLKDRKKVIISNSIVNPPLEINDYANLLNSDIKYNWINYASDILTNKIHNMQNNEDYFYMNDFHIYIFENQIDYKIKLYKVDYSFKEVK